MPFKGSRPVTIQIRHTQLAQVTIKGRMMLEEVFLETRQLPGQVYLMMKKDKVITTIAEVSPENAYFRLGRHYRSPDSFELYLHGEGMVSIHTSAKECIISYGTRYVHGAEEREEAEELLDEVSKQMQTLSIRNLPIETTPEQVKALSADILEVRMDVRQNTSLNNPKYAILEFSNPETAKKNLEKLRGQKVNGADIIVDFGGGKSLVSSVKPQLAPACDPLKLYVTGFGRNITVDQLKKVFPTSTEITLPLNPKDNNRPVGYAFVHYSHEAAARDVHDSMQNYVYNGLTLTVMYGKRTASETEGKRTGPAGEGVTPAEKRKKNEEDEEEEDEEEDDHTDEELEESDEEDNK